MTVSDRPVAEVSVSGPTAGLLGQLLLLAAVAALVGLGTAGWLVGAAYAVTVWFLLSRALRQAGMTGLGAANQVTLARATLVGCVAALVADSIRGHSSVAVIVLLATVALALDGVDGQVARRTGTASALGARFDVEIDAVLLVVLSVFVARSSGGWVLAIGLLRYAFVVAVWLRPWLGGALPPRLARKAVAAVQGIVLVVATAGVLPRPWTTVVLAAALGALVWSFGRDIWWLAGRRQRAVAVTVPLSPAVGRRVLATQPR